MNKHQIIKTPYHSILENCAWDDIVNGYFNSSNLMAGYLNDYSSTCINSEVADFLQENIQYLDKSDIEEILDNPDYIITSASHVFYDALSSVLDKQGCNYAEWALRHANVHFGAWDKYYIFANGDIASMYIIRAFDDTEAINELITRFEKAFAIDEEDVINSEQQQYNDNGTPINMDYLQLLGSFEFTKP